MAARLLDVEPAVLLELCLRSRPQASVSLEKVAALERLMAQEVSLVRLSCVVWTSPSPRMGALKMSTATLASISLGLLLAALASDYWVKAKDHTGLWQVCRDSFCQPYGMDVLAYIHATRAFMLMAAFAGAISFFGFWHLVCSSSAGSVTSSKISAVASLLAGLSALIAMSVFTGVYNTYYSVGHYGWSLGVGWASVPLFLITGGLGFQVVAETAM